MLKQNQSIIVKSNNPLGSNQNDVSYNFDIQSKSSAFFFNEDEMAEYQEKMHDKIQEVWQQIDQQNELAQQ